jgi:GDP-4-dehydro-6-deoxy-D-mannose reductase
MAELAAQVITHQVDLLESDQVAALVEELQPAFVFHLAGLSSPAASWDDPAATISSNVGMQANLLSSLTKVSPLPRVLVIGSGDEYGRAPTRVRRLSEETPLRPLTPYGVSKVAQDLLGLQYFLSHGLPVVRVRPFNHAGPRQSPQFVVASFARQIASIERGSQPPVLKVGNLQSRRDFTDVRDMMRAYVIAIEKGRPGEVYNLGSGVAVKIADILDRLLHLSRTRISVQVDEHRKHVAEAEIYVCDASRFHRLTGWRPQISLQRTLRDTLEFWRRAQERAA